MAATEIKEGFLCPICMKDLGTVIQLQEHFESAHSNEDKAVIHQLKGLFGKAKRKLLGREGEDAADSVGGATAYEEEGPPVSSAASVSGIDPILWEPQELGAIRSYTDVFKQVRDARVDRFVVETNKLLIRLDRLVSFDAPTDPGKRKAYEKKVVQWAPDSDVNLCITCGRSFSLIRRRHHCRLCGGIMCNKCSQFLTHSFAQKLTNPSSDFSPEEGFHRSNSNSSLNSIMSPEGEPHIRTCTECRSLLERRYIQMEQRNSKPVIVQLYEKLRQYLLDAEDMLPTYQQMSDSLNAGETSYSLQQAGTLRVKLIKCYESIDALSKRIGCLGLNAENPPNPKVLMLQRQIRNCASHFLQENMLGLQSLPNADELAKLQEARRQEIQRHIAAERQAAIEREKRKREEQRIAEEKARSKYDEGRTSPKKSPIKQASPGWQPTDSSHSGGPDDDPMIQQMNIIRSYIKQARQAQKWDEVSMLEDNLKDLQAEFWRQKKNTS